jgi:hexokinase
MHRTIIDNVAREFELPLARLRLIRQAVGAEMDAGLAGRKSSIAMLPAYCDAATGREKGHYLALDLGGTNFRVSMVRLPGAGKPPCVVAEAKYRLTREQISGSGTVLFDAIAGYLGKFLKDNRFTAPCELGYTFSFPVRLLGIAEGILLKWTKDFSAKGVVGRKIVTLQRQALTRKGITNVAITALANDTVGTLQARAVLDPDCAVGVILGTGFNIAIRVPARRIRKDTGDYSGASMIINMEAGGFGKALPRTRFDRQLDRATGNPGHQFAEKMISGKYLPQLVQGVMLEAIRKHRLFGGQAPEVFARQAAFGGQHMDAFIAGSRTGIAAVARDLFGEPLPAAERRALVKVCRIVSRRSARLAAALIVGSLSRAEFRSARRVTVAVDGSLFEKSPGYARLLKAALRELDGANGRRIRLVLTKDGSGIGAAVIASVAGTNAGHQGRA